MNLSDFDYGLPKALIARHPEAERDASRLLILSENGNISDVMIRDIHSLVRPGDVWVLNDTKVLPARLPGKKASGGKVEILLLEPASEAHIWLAWGKSNKPLESGIIIHFSKGFSGEILSRNGKQIRIRLTADDVASAIEKHGHMPLPPYIDRPDTEEDKQRYQTIYAKHTGAAAAPTAGLHLTQELMARMQAAGAEFAHVTLHVGPGTFEPVQVDKIENHAMHEEAYQVPEKAAVAVNAALDEGRRVVAVGTTSLRTLEAACTEGGRVETGAGRTSIFIYPGYRFRVVSALLTNFHLPQSTLLMLVSALAGRERIMAAYEHARSEGYRFYSYGDAMFID
ncbi:MAG: tRNA preQ1(34) S-adenosylmethionine ribosyltransferase-isomerase QueA [Mariprofundaceae bacterium]